MKLPLPLAQVYLHHMKYKKSEEGINYLKLQSSGEAMLIGLNVSHLLRVI